MCTIYMCVPRGGGGGVYYIQCTCVSVLARCLATEWCIFKDQRKSESLIIYVFLRPLQRKMENYRAVLHHSKH